MTRKHERADAPLVIVINDDLTQLNILKGLLKNEGYRVRAFQEPGRALGFMDENPGPELVVTDLYMPEIDGWRFCRLIRSPEYARLNDIPVFVISSTFAGEDAEAITEGLGADAFMASPVDGRLFLKKVKGLINGEFQRSVPSVLVVEDSRSLAAALKDAFNRHGFNAQTALDMKDAVSLMEKTFFDTAVIDYHLPDGTGEKLLEKLVHSQPSCVCIMMTADPRPELALEWMKKGAADYLKKPFKSEYLLEVCSRARRQRALLRVEDLLEERTRELKAKKENFHIVAVNSSSIIAILDSGLRYELANPSHTRLGYTPDELEGRSFFEIVHPDDTALFSGSMDKEEAEESLNKPVRFRAVAKTGEIHFVEGTLDYIKDAVGRLENFVFVGDDVTRRQLAEQQIRNLSAEREMLLETIPTHVWYLTDPETYGTANRSHAEFLGLSKDAVEHRTLPELFPEDVVRRIRQGNIRAFSSGTAVQEEEWMPDAEGEPRLLSVTKTPKLDANGDVEFVVCAAADITKLRSAEKRFRAIFETAPMGVALFDSSWKMEAANRACLEIFGAAGADELRTPVLFPDQEASAEELEKLEKGETVHYESRYELSGLMRKGLRPSRESGFIDLDVMITPLKNSEDRPASGYLVILQDITEQKRARKEKILMERRKSELQRMESLSRMAGAVAHHYNNQLAAVIGNLEIIKEEIPGEAGLLKNLEDAMAAAEKAAETSRQMLGYLGQMQGNLVRMDLSEACRTSLSRLKAGMPEEAELHASLPEQGPVVRADQDQFAQVLEAFFENACEAVENRPGKLSITLDTAPAEDIPSSDRFPVDWKAESKSYARLAVSDNGRGIDRDNISRIFDPFYTDKFTGRGLGLAVALGIVRAHRGCISVESEPGRGSCFRAFWPLV